MGQVEEADISSGFAEDAKNPLFEGASIVSATPPSGSLEGGVLVTVQGAVVVLPMDRRFLLWEHRT